MGYETIAPKLALSPQELEREGLSTLARLRRIAEVEFADIVVQTDTLGPSCACC